MSLIDITQLCVGYGNPGAETRLVENVDLTLEPGETLSIVGPSGSGKTLTACALSGLLPPPLRILSGTIRFQNQILNWHNPSSWRHLRGRKIWMLFQSPSLALNPAVCIRNQIAEVLVNVMQFEKARARRAAGELLERAGVPAQKGEAFPFQLSGGMRQRVLIAMALALTPDLLIADEPAVGLDEIHRMEILQLMQNLNREDQMAMIIITHDLRIASVLTRRALVMFQGRIVEAGTIADLIQTPKHAYTQNLVESLRYLEGNE